MTHVSIRGVARRGGSKNPGGAKPSVTRDAKTKVRARHSVQCWVKLIFDTLLFAYYRIENELQYAYMEIY